MRILFYLLENWKDYRDYAMLIQCHKNKYTSVWMHCALCRHEGKRKASGYVTLLWYFRIYLCIAFGHFQRSFSARLCAARHSPINIPYYGCALLNWLECTAHIHSSHMHMPISDAALSATLSYMLFRSILYIVYKCVCAVCVKGCSCTSNWIAVLHTSRPPSKCHF